ncbi:cryptochrome [Polyplosphaeria fusca]|uniref:Cryptochrome DASH n=1 Tax=Polyplosphaeria fusca TaxID=682080 RepID=A0A9P4V2N1_9PLEO|nr:cryptochrome [Polyplosphaeria fusca]
MTMALQHTRPRILIYLLRRDVRLSDNPLFHHASSYAASKSDLSRSASRPEREDSPISNDIPPYTHLLPVYIFPSNQIETSGFAPKGASPYPEARSKVAGIWRTGPHRAKFLAEGAWDLKQRLERLGCGSGLELRAGTIGDVVQHMLQWYADQKDQDGNTKADVAAIWMTAEEGTEENEDERQVKHLAENGGAEFKLWDDEKFYVDDRDLPFDEISDLPNVYTTYRKSLEPLRKRPRKALPTPKQLPPLPPDIPPQDAPFNVPSSLSVICKFLLAPLQEDPSYGLPSPPHWPEGAETVHPFEGGEIAALERLSHLVTSGAMSSYKDTRNGMLGVDFSTKLSAWLAQGHLTARQVHWAMVDFEEGHGEGENAEGYGKGENAGTAAVRFELLWRDYMRLCVRKFGARMFHVDGIQDSRHAEGKVGVDGEEASKLKRWRYIDRSGGAGDDPAKTLQVFTRFRSGRTGIGLIDASNRELFLTGYTSNRARQNVASFLASHLGIDWRLGAEWYEFLLIDYDIGNNWGNWQYVAGVGNDPRQGRVFNPVKQALDYDAQGDYVRTWVAELRNVQLTTKATGSTQEDIDKQKLMGLFQAWRLSDVEKEQLGLRGLDWVDSPLKRIPFSVGKKGSDGDRRKRGRSNWHGGGRGGGGRRQGLEDKAVGRIRQNSDFNGWEH